MFKLHLVYKNWNISCRGLLSVSFSATRWSVSEVLLWKEIGVLAKGKWKEVNKAGSAETFTAPTFIRVYRLS